MEETDSSQSNEIIEIASDGDVIFVVGPEMVRFRVRSQSLRAVSKPFFAMLGPDWKEGHDMLDKDGPVELSLPEDNPAALKMTFALVHRREGMVPRTLTPRFVLEVAITVDKYDLVDFMKFASGEWLRPGQRCADDLMILAAAAYLFQNAQGFKEITKALLLEHEDSYPSLLSKEVESVMAWRVFCLLEEQRSIFRLKLAHLLVYQIHGGDCLHYRWRARQYAYSYLTLLKRKKLWPADLRDISISKALGLAKIIAPLVTEKHSALCPYANTHSITQCELSRCQSLEDLLNDHVGLCLDCVRSGKTDMRPYCDH